MSVRAVRILGAGAPEVLELGEIARPEPGPDEVRVRVAAAGVNRADLLQRRGVYPAPAGAPVDIPGLEYAGTVDACGARVTRIAPGARVMGIVAGGAMAEEVVVHERETVRVPEGLDLVRAAAIPEVFITAWDALFRQARVGPGTSVLIHAAASGVGTAALQLALWAGARVVGTVRDEAKRAPLRALGLEHVVVVDRTAPRFADAVQALFGAGTDVILDGVGGSYLSENLATLAPRGTLVVIGLLGGASAPLPLGALLSRRAHIVGTVLRSRPLEEKIELARSFEREIVPAFESGALQPVVAEVLDMREVRAAHARLEENAVVGKIVMRW